MNANFQLTWKKQRKILTGHKTKKARQQRGFSPVASMNQLAQVSTLANFQPFIYCAEAKDIQKQTNKQAKLQQTKNAQMLTHRPANYKCGGHLSRILSGREGRSRGGLIIAERFPC